MITAFIPPGNWKSGEASAGSATTVKVEDRTEIAGRFLWRNAFDITVAEKEILVQVAINLIPFTGVRSVDLRQKFALWKRGIEDVWSDRVQATSADGRCRPIRVQVSFFSLAFHHRVVVVPGDPGADALHWGIESSAWTVAHEFGHLIGAFDEYAGGALAPNDPVIDPDGIMTDQPERGEPRERNYRLVEKWLADVLADPSLKIRSLATTPCPNDGG